MKLFYMPGACSLSPHIALLEAGLPFQTVKVGRDKQTADGRDFRSINPYGYVPALELDDGTVLTEGPAIVQYIADRAPDANIAPANGTLERYKLQAALSLINSEIHKTVGSLFNGAITDLVRESTIEKIGTRLTLLSAEVEKQGGRWVVNNAYSVADAYLFVVMRWLAGFKIDINQWPVIAAHSKRVAGRAAVQAALKAEGLD